jgi:plasmid stabilization system protein ParE
MRVIFSVKADQDLADIFKYTYAKSNYVQLLRG